MSTESPKTGMNRNPSRHPIAHDQQAQMTIALPAKPTEQERYAASELRFYLERMTGAPFEVAEGPCAGRRIALGAAAAELGVADTALGDDGFRVKTVGADIAILGGKRGVIYGAYELLERLGCRFFTATCERVPTATTLPLPDLDIREVPRLEYREHNYGEFTRYSRFAVKSRINGHFAPIREKHGGAMKYAKWFVHTFDALVPQSIYGETHPEYFSMVGGKRLVARHRSQLCLTNRDVLDIATESVRSALLANPQARIVSVSQNDWRDNCECPACRAVDEEERSPAGALLRFVNAIAERLEPEFPGVVFDTLAYTYTRPVPRITRPRHNVCVRLCSIECCFSHPFETCGADRSVVLPDGSRSSFVKDLHDWGNWCGRVYIWDYTTSFTHYPAPFPNWRSLQPNMRAFVANNVRGVFAQGNGSVGGGSDLNELRAYVIAKLLWDADTDVGRHIREFTDHYYGAAAPYVRDYINLLCDTAERENIHVGFNEKTALPLYREEILERLDALLRQAEAAVSGDALRHWRVARARLSVRYVRLKNKAMVRHEHDAEEINRFFDDWRAYGLTRTEEWVSAETSHRAMLRDRWHGSEFYAHWSGEGKQEEL